MFTFNGWQYDAQSNFAELIDKWLHTGGAPELPGELFLAPALTTLDGAARGTPEHVALASAALDRMEAGTPDEVEKLAGLSVVLAPRAVDRVLGFSPEKWRAFGGWLNLLRQFEQTAPEHPRFVPLLRNRAERGRDLDRLIAVLARYDARWLADHLEGLPRCTHPTHLVRALLASDGGALVPLAEAIARVYAPWAGEIERRIAGTRDEHNERRQLILALGVFSVDVDAPTLLDLQITR